MVEESEIETDSETFARVTSAQQQRFEGQIEVSV